MIRFCSGDMFESGAEALVNTVNTEGRMGKGLALQFKKRFPANLRAYEEACAKKLVIPGKMFIFEQSPPMLPKYIINFPTKTHWKNKSRMTDILSGLDALKQELQRLKITSVAIPPLGCGLGGLNWLDVKKAIETTLADVAPVDIMVYQPIQGKNPAPVSSASKILTPARAAIISAFQQYMAYAISVEMTFVEAHKLTYLMQELGLPLRLRFAPWRYGPYANNLGFVLSDMESHYIEGYRDGTSKAFDTFRLLPESTIAISMVKNNSEIATLLSRLENFIAGFESPTGLELLATTHWLATKNSIPLETSPISDAIANWCSNRSGWGDRKKKLFSSVYIGSAVERVKTLHSSCV